ncbi:MAG: hypothetical protein JW703_02040 [Candidatus Diapherotrites archaeon]|nr:hypothetical protein [Candidatus Diapherotrites archaeon]
MDLFFLAENTGILEGINLSGNWLVFAVGLILIIAAIAVILSLKKIIINSVLGLIGWAVTVFVFKVSLPFIPSLVISVIFGLAGIGVMLLLKFFGIM